jgi:hypothetical protein
LRVQIAISNASNARSARNVVEVRQPMIRLENTSVTNAVYTNPDQVATYVMSAIHNWFGAVARNWRSTRSPGRAATSAGIVVRARRPRTRPANPAVAINRSTVQRATVMPSRFNCRQILRAPYTR